MNVAASQGELQDLVEIARAITQERNIDRLLDLILEKSRFITNADAGSIYVIESDPVEGQRLRFKLTQNDSCKFEAGEFTLPLSYDSIAGAAVLKREAINIRDVYDVRDEGVAFDKSFDERAGYRTCSMLAVPLISAEREVLGVVQLINKKTDRTLRLLSADDVRKFVMPFDEHSEQVLTTLAAQAGIALENALLYADIQKLFAGFVRASVQAIEQRDPTTSGHSLRVSVLSRELAKAVDSVTSGRFGQETFSKQQLQELEYAALLHDFGKIGVREDVLVKAKKLYPQELALIHTRILVMLQQYRAEFLEAKLALVESHAPIVELEELEQRYVERCHELRDAWEFVHRANEPSILQQGDFSRIVDLSRLAYADDQGRLLPLLTPQHIKALQVTKGSLTHEELEEIRQHVTHSFQFLSKIPWGNALGAIPAIAAAHHERLNGTGYPYGLTSDEIPLQSKIMAVADIYDALTAADRPYKKALDRHRALEILDAEAKAQHIDGQLVRLFREAEVYKQLDAPLHY
ncbi:MAG: GAF domain-containing protein [Myxococcales bacterium]|nr:GAF domain-containing protein [Myxococcales bacterium]MCB9709503.1 GAF domain-containing protein [Myxococcales bacterium]